MSYLAPHSSVAETTSRQEEAAAQTVREPGFFLVGASRAGTTSLWQHLVAHPDIYMPWRSGAEKEPCFFCDVTPRWALAYRDKARYLELFAEAGDRRAVGEASTPYLAAPESPGRIRAMYPDAKIIILLRHPVRRAFSLYRFLCVIGGEWATSFEKALELERPRMHDAGFTRANPLWYGLYQYFHSGLYSAQVERFLEAFPERQVLILLSDDLASDTVGATQRVYRFLGVDSSFVPPVRRYNESLFPLSVTLQYWLAHDTDRSAGARMSPLTARLFHWNGRLGRLLPRCCRPETSRRLADAYRDDIARTARLLGRPLDLWLRNDEFGT